MFQLGDVLTPACSWPARVCSPAEWVQYTFKESPSGPRDTVPEPSQLWMSSGLTPTFLSFRVRIINYAEKARIEKFICLLGHW